MNKFTSLYEFTISISNGKESPMVLTNDDIVSISFINDFDNALFPIIRLRLYIDIDKLSYINEDPNNLSLSFSMFGSIYKINQNENETTYDRYKPLNESITDDSSLLYGYVETKNNPYSKYDNYQMGEKRDNSLNTNVKVPLTIYCYDKEIIRGLKRRVNSIYRNTTIFEIISGMFRQCDVHYEIHGIDNNERFDQVLIPNLSLLDAIGYLDTYYGIYKSGSTLYSNKIGTMNLMDTDIDFASNVDTVIVSSYKAGDSFSGICDPDNLILQTPDTSVVVKSQTDLEQAVNARIFGSINVNDFISNSETLNETFKDSDMSYITTPDILHKTKNQFIPSMYKARVNERNTRIDLSLSGYPMRTFGSSGRFLFTFENSIRGIEIGRKYRPMYSTHTFTNIGSGLFDIQSTFQLC